MLSGPVEVTDASLGLAGVDAAVRKVSANAIRLHVQAARTVRIWLVQEYDTTNILRVA